MEYINNRIENEVCDDTIKRLDDTYLMPEYRECKSVKCEIKKLEEILEKYHIETHTKNSIINDYIFQLIPPGTKGVIRGNKFNSIVKQTIMDLQLDTKRFDVCFEKQCELSITSEIPDWYILEKNTSRVIIGMNQLDLWSGGQQLNRGYKYIINNLLNTDKTKLLCVVCNKVKISNTKNKIYKLFDVGFSNNTLCYLKNLPRIIKLFFS